MSEDQTNPPDVESAPVENTNKPGLSITVKILIGIAVAVVIIGLLAGLGGLLYFLLASPFTLKTFTNDESLEIKCISPNDYLVINSAKYYTVDKLCSIDISTESNLQCKLDQLTKTSQCSFPIKWIYKYKNIATTLATSCKNTLGKTIEISYVCMDLPSVLDAM